MNEFQPRPASAPIDFEVLLMLMGGEGNLPPSAPCLQVHEAVLTAVHAPELSSPLEFPDQGLRLWTWLTHCGEQVLVLRSRRWLLGGLALVATVSGLVTGSLTPKGGRQACLQMLSHFRPSLPLS